MKLKWSLYSPAWEHAPLMMAVVSPWYSGQCTDSAMNCMFLLAEAFIVSTELVFSQCWHTVLRMAVTHKYSRSLGSCMLLLWSLHKMLIVTFVHCFNDQIIAKDLQNAHVPPGRGNWCWCTIITVMFTKNFTYIIILSGMPLDGCFLSAIRCQSVLSVAFLQAEWILNPDITDCTLVSISLGQLICGCLQGLLHILDGQSEAPVIRWWF